MRQYYIYILINPKNGEIFYVGCTVNPKHSLTEHRTIYNKVVKRGCNPKPLWARPAKDNYMLHHKICPDMEIIDQVFGTKETAEFFETYWMHQLKSWGFSLTNTINSGSKYSDVKSRFITTHKAA